MTVRSATAPLLSTARDATVVGKSAVFVTALDMRFVMVVKGLALTIWVELAIAVVEVENKVHVLAVMELAVLIALGVAVPYSIFALSAGASRFVRPAVEKELFEQLFIQQDLRKNISLQ